MDNSIDSAGSTEEQSTAENTALPTDDKEFKEMETENSSTPPLVVVKTENGSVINPEKHSKPEVSSDSQTLLAVLAFLKKNNFKETEELLLREASLNSVKESLVLPPAAVASSSSLVASVSGHAYDSQTSAVRISDSNAYSEYYRFLVNFIENSLDTHKFELNGVLFPLFAHMYLKLVSARLEDQAKEFFDEFSISQEYFYENDLIRLSAVTKPEHLRENQLLQELRSSQYTVRMSRESCNHLKRHLVDKGYTTLLDIIQDQLNIEMFDGPSRSCQQIFKTSGAMTGAATLDANSARVFYGLLKEPDITVKADEGDQQESQQSATNDESKPPKKKKSKKDPMLTKKSKIDPNAPVQSRVPLPMARDADKMERVRAFRESTKRVRLSNENLPSICFYTLLNSSSGVTTAEISEDSSMLAAGFDNSTIRVWSVTSSKLTSLKPADELNVLDKECDDVLERIMDEKTASDSKILRGHTGPVFSVSFSPDRAHLISGSEDGTVRLWSLLTWSNVVCYKGHLFPVWGVKFGPYGHYFASCGADRTARLWCTDHYQPLRIFAGHFSDVDCIEFHPNSNYVASGSTDRTVRLWDVVNGACVRVMTGHKDSIQVLTFCSNGKYLASAGVDKLIILWDISTGDLVTVLNGHTDTVYSLSFSRDLSILASGSADFTVKLWDVKDLVNENKNQELDSEDGSSATNTDGNTTSKAAKELESFRSKSTSVLCVHFTRRNLLLASGPFLSSTSTAM